MALPEIKHPVFKITIPSTNKQISYRPYTVQEEKLLLIVRMSEDLEEIIQTLKQILKNCIVDDVDIDKLAMFDIEYIFLNIRKDSVSNEVELIYNDEDKQVPFKVNLSDVKIKFNKEHTSKIQINDTLGIKLKYPNLDAMLRLEYAIREAGMNEKAVDESIFRAIIGCVEYVYDDNKIYDEFTKDELEKFLTSLKIDELAKVQKFFTTMPVLEHEVILKLGKDRTTTVTLRGIKDFFTF